MRLENIVWDARDPHRLGAFWAAALGAEPLTDEPDLHEARVHLAGGVFLDLCFPRVDPVGAGWGPPRLHLDLAGGTTPQGRDGVVGRLLALGARRADIGQGDVPWTVLADPEGGTFCVMEDRPAYRRSTGPVAALPLDSADPVRDASFWSAVTGWVPAPDASGRGVVALRHPDGVGPLLELCPEPEPSRGKNRVHLDVRREHSDGEDSEDDDDVVLARLRDLGATPLSAPGEHPWLVVADPSGNELCVLPPAG